MTVDEPGATLPASLAGTHCSHATHGRGLGAAPGRAAGTRGARSIICGRPVLHERRRHASACLALYDGRRNEPDIGDEFC